MGDKNRGWFKKYTVTRNDGKEGKGTKHYGCELFVMDLTHDPYALLTMHTYAEACSKEYPLLAKDIREKLTKLRQNTLG